MYSLSLRFVLPAFLPFLLAETGTEYFGTYFYKMQSPENGTGVSVLSVGEAGNLLQCTRQCLVTPGCDKEAYHRSNKTCILAGDETMGTLVVDMDVQDEDWVYYTSNLQNTSVNQMCDDGWLNFNHSCYFVSTTFLDWMGSSGWCSVDNGHLVTIRSLDENQFVLDLVNTTLRAFLDPVTLSTTRIWIGSSIDSVTNTYQWVTGETWGFSNFVPGEPNDELSQCLAMSPVVDTNGDIAPFAGFWEDKLCPEDAVFVCEKDV